ncbi:MAG: hypothetical protein J5647_00040 [Spirochaetaceae bacterium]|nr:hypothetical protein [Spirochaetaceae bacterium]
MEEQNKGTVFQPDMELIDMLIQRKSGALVPEEQEQCDIINDSPIDYTEHAKNVLQFCVAKRIRNSKDLYYSTSAIELLEAACKDAYKLGRLERMKGV